MHEKPLYTVFRTKWGYFAIAAVNGMLARTILPVPTAAGARQLLLSDLPHATPDKNCLAGLQEQIIAYFEGEPVVFGGNIEVHLPGLTPFTARILAACRKIPPGKTATYGSLAHKAGRPKAARAVGNAMGSNPIPLIIPCHRVITATGSLGGFSAVGGVTLKKKLLDHEKRIAL